MSDLKLLKFPKSEPKSEPTRPMSPQEEMILQAYKLHPQIKNVVILVQTDTDNFTAFQAVDENVDMWTFVDVVRLKALQATNDYLTTGMPGPLSPVPA